MGEILINLMEEVRQIRREQREQREKSRKEIEDLKVELRRMKKVAEERKKS